MIDKLKYLFAKFIYYLQIPSCRDCEFADHVKVYPRTNLVRVKAGRYTYIGVNNSMQDVEIGAFCSIGSYNAIGGGVHPMDQPSTSPVFYEKENCFKQPDFLYGDGVTLEQPKTTIGNDVWIGDQCFIKAGVKVGDGAVVGAHAVVTHDVPPYAIVAGNPARVLRYRFKEEEIAALLQLKWWEWSDEEIKKNKSRFRSVETLITRD